MSTHPRPSTADLDHQRLAAIIESSDDAIVSKTLDGIVLSWNPAAERIFGYAAEEILGRPIFGLIPAELHAEEHGLLARIRAGEHVASYETTRIRKDGRRILVSLTLSPVRTPDGRLVGASAIKRDITAQRALEAQLQQAQRVESIGRLTGGVAHDFNNLLTVITGLADLVRRRQPEGTRDRRDLDQVVLAAQRASELTQQLLTFSRRQASTPELLAVERVVLDLEPMLRRLIGENIEVRTDFENGTGPVLVNRGQLEQVVTNLVINARDAMPDGGRLTLETRNTVVRGDDGGPPMGLRPGRYVVLGVADTGEGMDEATQASIFEPFFTTKAPGQGTGLGLVTVQGIVAQAGGAVRVESAPGQGARFEVFLPIATGGEEAPAVEAPSTPANDRPDEPATVLLAEDDPSVRSFARYVLVDAGYEVLDAPDGRAALDLAAAHAGPIALLLTDVVMPGMNGRELAEALTATRPRIGVLYMSGYTDDMILRAGVATAGPDAAFLQKPFTPERLLTRVRTVLRRTSGV